MYDELLYKATCTAGKFTEPFPLLTQFEEPDKIPELYVADPVTVNVPPVLFLKVVLPFEYVPPVTLTSVGKFRYVVADIVSAVKFPFTVRPVTVLNNTE